MKISVSNIIDERFWKHRLRAGCIAGIIGSVVAQLLFAYRYLVHHIWNWDLLAVAVTIAGVGLALMMWYRLTD